MATREIPLVFEKFEAEHFPEYQSWYEDPELNRHLGPMDHVWLDDMLEEPHGREFSVFRGEELVAVVRVYYPDPDPFYYISEFAVKPGLRKQGIGSLVLEHLMETLPLANRYSWRALVHDNNQAARTLFEKHGFVSTFASPEDDGMHYYEYCPSGNCL